MLSKCYTYTVHVLMDLPNGDLVAAGAIYCVVKKSCLLNGTLEYNIQL